MMCVFCCFHISANHRHNMHVTSLKKKESDVRKRGVVEGKLSCGDCRIGPLIEIEKNQLSEG